MASDAEEQRSDRILDFLISKRIYTGVRFALRDNLGLGRARDHFDPDPDSAEGAPVEGSAVVPVMCSNCGHTMPFGARTLPNQRE